MRCAQRNVPPSGIEPEPPGLQPSAQTIYARVATCESATCRTRVVIINYSLVKCPASQAVVVQGKSVIHSFSRAAENRTLITRLKAKCSTIELRPQNEGVDLFSTGHLFSFRGHARNRTETAQKRARFTAAPGATPVCAPQTRRAAREDLSKAAPDRFGYSACVYESGAFSPYVVGCCSHLKFTGRKPSWCAHVCLTVPLHLTDSMGANTIDMMITRKSLARCRAKVNDYRPGRLA